MSATAPADMDPVVGCVVTDGVAVVRFERPERRNAWNAEMQAAYRAAMGRAERDPQVRVVVVTGAGDAFCVGGDMAALRSLAGSGAWTQTGSSAEDDATFGADLGRFAFVRRMTKPVIAAINGPTAGVGLVLACFCDLRFAAEGAKLTTAMARLGLPAEQGLSWVLPRLVGSARAFDLLVSSPVIRAEDALAIGLVDRVLPRDDLLAATLEYARSLAGSISPASMRMMKRQLLADQSRDLPASIAEAADLATAALSGPDYAEGVSAFVERRPPRFGSPRLGAQT